MRNMTEEAKKDINISNILEEIGKKISLSRKGSRKKIDSISRTLKISSQYLLAIEDGDINKLPSRVYLKGFIKSYAEYFNADISRELELLDTHFKQLETRDTPEKVNSKIFESMPNQKVFIFTLTIFVVIFYLWDNYKKSIDLSLKDLNIKENDFSEEFVKKEKNNLEENITDLEEKNNLEENITDLEENNNLEENLKMEKEKINEGEVLAEKKVLYDDTMLLNNLLGVKNKLKIIFLDKTWIQIKAVNGSIIKSGIFENGEVIFLEKDEENNDFYIDTGNAGGFKLIFEDKELPILGEIGSVKKNISLVKKIKEVEN